MYSKLLSPFSTLRPAFWLFAPLALLLALAPLQAKGQTCYAEASGNWSNTDIWAPSADGDPTQNCDGGDGVPGSGETAVITSGFSVDVASNTTVGTLNINDDAGGVFLNGGDLTVENDATVGETTTPGTATLNTFEDDDPSTVTASGKLQINGSLTAFGDIKVFREDGGNGELDLTGSNGSGDFTIESSGSFRGGRSAPTSVAGTLTNNNGDDSNIISERCYIESSGTWDTAGNWAPIGGTSPSRTCDRGGDGNGVPGSGETAVIPAGNNAQVSSSITIGSLEINDGATGGFITGGSLTVEEDLQVGKTTSPNGAKIQTYNTSLGSITSEGPLTVNGSIVSFGTIKVDRTDGGTGELDLNNTNGSGNLTVKSSGIIDINQFDNATSAPIDIAGDLINEGDFNQATTNLPVGGELSNSGALDATNGANITVNSFTNNGDITLNGAELSATGLGVDSENGSSSTANLNLGTGGILDVAHAFSNGTSGTLDYAGATLELANDFTNNGTFVNSGSLTIFDGGGDIDQVLSGTLTGNNASFVDFRIEDDAGGNPSVVDPATKVEVIGTLTVKSNNRYGTKDPQENSDLRYEGSSFSVSGELYANVVEFAANNISDGTVDSYTTVSGAVFAEVNVLNTTAVEVGTTSFTVFGLVDVFTDSVLNVANNSATLELAADFNVDGDIEASSGTIKFNGEGGSTDCSLVSGDLDCGTSNNIQEYDGASQSFNALRIQDEDGDSTVETEVEFSDSGSPITVTSDLIIDEATLTTARPITLNNGNLTVQGGGDITITNDRKLTFTGSSPRDVVTPGGLTVSVLEVRKGGGTQTLKDNLTVTDSLLMTSGTLAPEQTLTVQERLVLGGPIDATSTLDVTGGGGTAKLVSNSSNDAYVRYVDSDGDGTIDGSVNGPLTFQRQLDGIQNWYYMGAPADAGTNTTFEEFLEIGGQNDLWTAGITNSDNPSLAETSIRLYDESADGPADADDNGWKGISDVQNNMVSGKGYVVYVWSDEDMDGTNEGFPKIIDSNVSPRTSETFVFSTSDGSGSDGPGIDATDNHGDGSGGSDGSIGSEEGWNLLSNPYFATVDFCEMTRGSGLSPVVQVWDPQNGTDPTSSSGYATYDCSDGTTGGAGDGLENGYLAPHQAFFVKAQSTSNLGLSMDVTEDQANTAGFFLKEKPSSEDQTLPPAISLKFNLNGMGYTASAAFSEGNSPGLDKSDGLYIGGASEKSGLSFYNVLKDGTPILTNSLPREISSDTTLAFAVDGCNYGTPLSGQASITSTLFRNIPPSWGVTLKDTKTGETINLRKASSYSFDYTGSCSSSKSETSEETETIRPQTPTVVHHSVEKDGGPDTRFQLIIDPDAVPPVELSKFTATAKEQGALLSWTTTRERNLEAFYVQRKTEDGSFTTLENAEIKTSSASESSTYEYQVGGLDAGTHTFRLKQVTTSKSTATYSEPVEVKIGLDGKYKLKSYPNPVQTQATVEFAVKEESNVTITLYNTLGQKVRTVYREATPAEETRRVSLDTGTLSSGVYFLRLRGDGVMGTQRLTIVK